MKTKRTYFKVVGMYCTSCKPIIEKQMKDEKGKKRIDIDYMTDSVLVDFDPSIITKEEIKIGWRSQGIILLELLDDEYKSGLGYPNTQSTVNCIITLERSPNHFIQVYVRATRFGYALTGSADKSKEQLLNEYRSKHNDKLPVCMYVIGESN